MGTENEDGEIRMYPINEGQQRIRQEYMIQKDMLRQQIRELQREIAELDDSEGEGEQPDRKESS
jgi:hypothetical protein